MNVETNEIEIDEAAARLAELLKGCEITHKSARLSRVQSMAYPPSTKQEVNSQSRVMDICAAQRAVAFFLRLMKRSAKWLEN